MQGKTGVPQADLPLVSWQGPAFPAFEQCPSWFCSGQGKLWWSPGQGQAPGVAGLVSGGVRGRCCRNTEGLGSAKGGEGWASLGGEGPAQDAQGTSSWVALPMPHKKSPARPPQTLVKPLGKPFPPPPSPEQPGCRAALPPQVSAESRCEQQRHQGPKIAKVLLVPCCRSSAPVPATTSTYCSASHTQSKQPLLTAWQS